MSLAKRYNFFQNIWIQASVLMALFICAYWIPLKGIVNVWMTNGDYSYGFIIPVISLYLFWDMRSRFKKLDIKSCWPVLPALFVFVLLSIYGILGSSGNVSRPLIPVMIIFLAWFCFGTRLVRRFILPLGFLFFMIPLPAVLDRTFGVFLKSISSNLGGKLIRLFGMSVNVSGNVIDLGVTKLQVVDACSGLRFVFPLLALGIVYAYFFERVRWKQVFCVASTIPIAILINVIRIGVTGILVNAYGPEMAEGFFHDFSGWLIFMAAFGFLFLEGRLLRLFPPLQAFDKLENKGNSIDRQTDSIQANKKAHGNGAFFVSVAMLMTIAILSWNTKALPAIKIKGGIKSFPLEFADWNGMSQQVDPRIVERSGAEESFLGLYKNIRGDEVSLYIGYRSTAFLENENFFHSPTVCLPSSGWKILAFAPHNIQGIPFFGNIEVSEMVVEDMDLKELVYFWFQTKNKVSYDKNINRLQLALHAIKHDNTHDLFIRPITPIGKDENVEDAEKRMDQFVKDMMGVLIKFLKENQFEQKI